MADEQPLIDVQHLSMHFPVKVAGGLLRKTVPLRAVDDVSFRIVQGETLGLVGESGCGKTTVGRALLQIYRPTAGAVRYRGQDLCRLKGEPLRRLRPRLQMIFQDPYASLDPRMQVGRLLAEPMRVHGIARGKQLEEQVESLLRMVGLNPHFRNRYPHEFSGGQRQRIGIARALAVQPEFIVCDEPISALDVSIQAQVLNLLRDLQEVQHLTYLFIAHDLRAVRHVSDRVAVMYLGKIVEITRSEDLYANPLHPYTRALLSAVPVPKPSVERNRKRILLKGDVPNPLDPRPGCPFASRCPVAVPSCRDAPPPLEDKGGGHRVACFRVERDPVLPHA